MPSASSRQIEMLCHGLLHSVVMVDESRCEDEQKQAEGRDRQDVEDQGEHDREPVADSEAEQRRVLADQEADERSECDPDAAEGYEREDEIPGASSEASRIARTTLRR
jgi:hypothetical protein